MSSPRGWGRRKARPAAPQSRVTRRSVAGLTAVLLGAGVLPATMGTPALAADGQGFNLNASDLKFILEQVQISEAHVASATPDNPCGTLLGTGPHQIPNQNSQGAELPWGLRTVDGTCNNLKLNQEDFGAADRLFPRRAGAEFQTAQPAPAGFPPGNGGPGQPTSYDTPTGIVYDSEPRTASNLIVDQTTNNPAAVTAAGTGAVADESGTLFIENTAPDEGLSAPFNSTFTLFGQFFDHGMDLVNKSGGAVFVPLQADDPLVAGDDGIFGNGDDLPPHLRFMVLTRAQNQPGPDGTLGTADDVQEATNQTSPYVDQSQTYTSHPSHQVFLREYTAVTPAAPGDAAADPNGRMLTGPGDGLATWGSVKDQAAALLGIELSDQDALNLPLLATDPYGNYLPGPNGLPQFVTATGTVEGNLTTPVPAPADVLRTGHAFLDDIAHHAGPFGDNDTNPGNAPGARQPDGDTVISADDRNNATYDDELLAAHFIAGDGRINENIGLTAIHHVFHSEHNRLVRVIDEMIAADQTLQAAWQPATAEADDWSYHQRLFQAARFVTEMEYQHLAFEEFARKVQPQVNLFAGYDTSIDAAITAEFAHAVYRFGHSMLTETVARTTVDGTSRDIALLDAFLNPPSFYDGVENPTPEQVEAATGDIIRGMTAQRGNEIDEFVTEALRNNLLGLPLDLATLNMARARETGVPPLNEARRDFHALTGDPALAPYANWIDFGLSLRHQNVSLVNFVAAYGTHPTITGTMEQRRAAAALLVSNKPTSDDQGNVTNPPADAVEFMNGTGAYANGGGLNDVDLWVGGLAETQSPFGGLLGSTFNFIFETQMENLQDGDRFYYLTRTAGLNLLVQLEGNSFAELISRNTNAENLPADVFSDPDMVFDLATLNPTGPPLDDDPATTDVDESTLLVRMADGTIRFPGGEHVMLIGTPNADKMRTGEGDDTLRGNEQNDRLEGGAGNDQFIGGSGEDVLTDTFGDDVLKGGDGHDYLSSGVGFDLNQGGLGDDFVVGGSDPTETFGGPGDDIVFAGDSSDTVFGDDGDDWIEGGGQADLLQGDNGAPFQDDPNTPGHDVINGNGGQDDYDAEGGDDIMLAGAGVERNEGMLGFDWVTHKNDPQAADDDLRVTGLLPPSVDALRDRFDLVEALSGGSLNDVLRGDDSGADPADAEELAGNELTPAGIARIEGLSTLLGGATSFTGGNIIIGGEGGDQLEGRGGNDLIDGDVWLNVRLRAPNPLTADPADTRLYDSLTARPLGVTTGPTLRDDVLAGQINPGDITIHRNIEMSPSGSFVDTARFSGPQAEYTITSTPNGLTVAHTGGTQADGVDTLRNIEQLRFGDGTLVAVPSVTDRTPDAGATGVAANANVVVTFRSAVVGVSSSSFTLTGPGGAVIPGGITSTTLANGRERYTLNPTSNLALNTPYTVTLTGGPTAIRNAAGVPLGGMSWSFTTVGDSLAPSVTARTPNANTTGFARGANILVTFSEVVQGVTTAPTAAPTFTVAPANGGAAVSAVLTSTTLANGQQRYTLNPNASLAANTQYRVTVTGGPDAIRDMANNPLAPTPPWTFTTGA